MKRLLFYINIALAVIAVGLTGCRGAKLSDADEQYARGEYYDASNTYRKIYNKLTKREERELRGEVAFKMGECYRRHRRLIKMRCAIITPTAWQFSTWHNRSTTRENMLKP